MDLCLDTNLVISASFFDVDGDVMEGLLDVLKGDFDHDDNDSNASWASISSDSPVSVSMGSPVGAKRIRADLDPLPLTNAEEATEYFTVDNYVWPKPQKRQCRRMPDELRRQRHRESQREFMTRKRALFRAMRAEISYLERQVQWLEARQELQSLTNEQQTLRAKVDQHVRTIQDRIWGVEESS